MIVLAYLALPFPAHHHCSLLCCGAPLKLTTELSAECCLQETFTSEVMATWSAGAVP